MKNKTNTYPTTHFRAGIRLLIIFAFLLSACGGFQSAYAQEQWRVFSMQNSGLPGAARYMAVDRNNVKWIGTSNGLAKLDGNNWTVYDTSNSPIPFAQIFSIAVDSLNKIWLGTWYGGGAGLVKFDGTNWTIYNTTNSGLPSNIIFSIAIDKNNIKWIGAEHKMVKFNDTVWTVFESSYFGLPLNTFWTTAFEDNVKWFGTFSAGVVKYYDTNYIVYNYSNSGIPSDDIRSISIDSSGNKWIATQFGGVAKFNSIANQWTVYNTTNSPLPENHVWAILADKKNTIWIGCNSAGVAKYDGNWTLFNTSNSPLPSNYISYFAEDKLENIWICCGYLVIYNENGIIGVKNEENPIITKYHLYQNYPNPFNSTTIIRYDLYENLKVELKVFDINGKTIDVLVNTTQNEGAYSINFGANNLASGIYFYQIITKNYTETKKMVLIK
jgi:ligand-binding sensor domain-containing protein